MRQFYSAGRATPRAPGNDVEGALAVEEAVAASVEWIMVRMDLVAHYKYLFEFISVLL